MQEAIISTSTTNHAAEKTHARPTKTPMGTRDYSPLEVRAREMVIERIKAIFVKHGAVTMDTPIMELVEALRGNYGEGSKEIFEVVPEGECGERTALRYDLTVPFARYVASLDLPSFKRYCIGKVYRRDTPRMTKGRYCEFYQCDFDYAGPADAMVPDAECAVMIGEIFRSLPREVHQALGRVSLRVNHRKLLDGLFAACGVPHELLVPVARSVDKLDKRSWDEVRAELIDVRGLDAAVADLLRGYVVSLSSATERFPEASDLIAFLRADPLLAGSAQVNAALHDLELMFSHVGILAPPGFVAAYVPADGAKSGFSVTMKLDLSLVRGLDYYTGVVFEAVAVSDAGSEAGSICGGGRYDGLVGSFRRSGEDLPAMGFSIGVERIFGIMTRALESQASGASPNATKADAMVATVGRGVSDSDRFALTRELWEAEISTHLAYQTAGRSLRKQLDTAHAIGVPFVVILGESEIQSGAATVKDMRSGEQTSVARSDLCHFLRSRLTAQAH